MKLTVWEVYEENTQRSISFGTKEDAENQETFSRVDFITESLVDFTACEVQRLIQRKHVAGD